MTRIETQRLRKRVLRNRFNSGVFRAGEEVYLVGGYLRDLVIKDAHSRDLDYVAGKNIRRLVNSVSKALGGRVVELRKERMLRVVLPGGVTLDFSKMDGDILNDLKGRDFTINAMAWSPGAGLIDPHGGLRDIEKGTIRAISVENLKKDPLRLLRAYRFSAEFGLPIARKTRGLMKPLSRRIRQAAGERITLEFFKLLNAENPSGALNMALSDGILKEIIPLSFNELRRNIKSISDIDVNIKKIHESNFLKEFSQGLTLRGLLRLEGVMLGANAAASLLALSTNIRKRLEATGRLHSRFASISKMGRSEVFKLFLAADAAATDLLVLTGNTGLLSEVRRFERIMATKGLLSTEEIMSTTGVGSGPRLGRIIRDLRRRQFERTLKGGQAARRWLSGLKSY